MKIGFAFQCDEIIISCYDKDVFIETLHILSYNYRNQIPANQDRNDSMTSSAEGSGQGESTDGALNMDYIVYDYDDYLFTTPSPKGT